MVEMTDGGAAFPYVVRGDEDYVVAGMSLRDYIATKAAATLLHGAVLPTKEDRDKYFPILAEVAYEMADAMIVARGGK